jgi:K+-sensing histidine kinase KdpD
MMALCITREVAARCGVANDMLERAEQRSGHLTRLMNDLLDVSRIQAGHLEMRQDTCDLAEIVPTSRSSNSRADGWRSRADPAPGPRFGSRCRSHSRSRLGPAIVL